LAHLRATILADDPIFGRFCYGGARQQTGGTNQVVPLDGVCRRFHAGPLTKSFSSPAADGLRRRKRGNTAHSRGFASSYATGLVAKRLECAGCPRFGLDFVNGPTVPRRSEHAQVERGSGL